MKKTLILAATLLAFGSLGASVVPSFAQTTTNASTGEEVGSGQNNPTKAEGTGGNGGDVVDCASSASDATPAASSSASAECPPMADSSMMTDSSMMSSSSAM